MRNVNDSELLKRLQEIETLLRANPLRAASVERGRTRFYAGSELLIEDSNLTVTGTATVFGVLRTVGRIILEGLGILTVNGRLEGSGQFDWTGPARVRGTLDIEGLTKLLSELVVEGKITSGAVRIEDGKVYIDGMVLDPTVAGGAATFPNGSRLEADGSVNGARVVAGDAVVNVGSVASMRKGDSSVIVAADGITINAAGGQEILLQGEVVIPVGSIPTIADTGLPIPNVLLITTTGRLRRSDGT